MRKAVMAELQSAGGKALAKMRTAEERSRAASIAGKASNDLRWGSTAGERRRRSAAIVKDRASGLSTAQIAAKFEVSVETVRKTLQKAREGRP